MKKLIQYAVLLCVVLWMSESVGAGQDRQRQEFLAARQAYEAGDLSTWQRLSADLKNYPLYPYLRYPYLRDKLDSVAESEVLQFLDRYGDSPPGTRLRNAWLINLARAQRWPEYLRLYRGSSDPTLVCYHLQARINQAHGKPDAELLDQAEDVWRVGHSQPSACDAVFSYLDDQHRMTDKLIWARLRLAFDEGELHLAEHLSRALSSAEQKWVQRWISMYRRPATQLANVPYHEDVPISREIIIFGLRRLARSAPETAHTRWLQLKTHYHFSTAQRGEVERAIAIAAARQRSPHALQWLTAIKDKDTDATLREWRIRSAVLVGDWAHVERWTGALPKEEQTESTQYWRARALEARGSQDGAQHVYKELARQRSYYGFLANDRLHQDYALNNAPIAIDDRQVAAIAAMPAMQRAYELYELGLIPEARREWAAATRKMSAAELAQAALLASRWGWYERAIMTAAQGENWDDLALRFPTPYRNQVKDNAQRQQLDPSWVYGVMRQESAFMADARSSAGALGLMQLMPATAKHTARLLDWPPHHSRDLLTPTTNIQLGSAYLRHILDIFNGNQMLATAAYNAGPGRVRQWLPDSTAPADQWVEAIPFTETRKYVQSVLSYCVIFDWRLDRPLQPLRRRMGSAVPTPDDLADQEP